MMKFVKFCTVMFLVLVGVFGMSEQVLAVCGNGSFDEGEDFANCPDDCGTGTCWTCSGAGSPTATCSQETIYYCDFSMGRDITDDPSFDEGQFCEDQSLYSSESSCEDDFECNTCGNGEIDDGEDYANCPDDCTGSCWTCTEEGSGVCSLEGGIDICSSPCAFSDQDECQSDEFCENTCGNGDYDDGENATNCPADCSFIECWNCTSPGVHGTCTKTSGNEFGYDACADYGKGESDFNDPAVYDEDDFCQEINANYHASQEDCESEDACTSCGDNDYDVNETVVNCDSDCRNVTCWDCTSPGVIGVCTETTAYDTCAYEIGESDFNDPAVYDEDDFCQQKIDASYFGSEGNCLADDQCTSCGDNDYDVNETVVNCDSDCRNVTCWNCSGDTCASASYDSCTYEIGESDFNDPAVYDEDEFCEDEISGWFTEATCIENSICEADSGGICGDGTVDDGEECDDGNSTADDACSNACEEQTCGDGVVNQASEQCDGTSNCTSECKKKGGAAVRSRGICGNGIKDRNEQCDEGENNIPHTKEDDLVDGKTPTQRFIDQTRERGSPFAVDQDIIDDLQKNDKGCLDNCTLAHCGDGIDNLDNDSFNDEEELPEDKKDSGCYQCSECFEDAGSPSFAANFLSDQYLPGLHNEEIHPCEDEDVSPTSFFRTFFSRVFGFFLAQGLTSPASPGGTGGLQPTKPCGPKAPVCGNNVKETGEDCDGTNCCTKANVDNFSLAISATRTRRGLGDGTSPAEVLLREGQQLPEGGFTGCTNQCTCPNNLVMIKTVTGKVNCTCHDGWTLETLDLHTSATLPAGTTVNPNSTWLQYCKKAVANNAAAPDQDPSNDMCKERYTIGYQTRFSSNPDDWLKCCRPGVGCDLWCNLCRPALNPDDVDIPDQNNPNPREDEYARRGNPQNPTGSQCCLNNYRCAKSDTLYGEYRCRRIVNCQASIAVGSESQFWCATAGDCSAAYNSAGVYDPNRDPSRPVKCVNNRCCGGPRAAPGQVTNNCSDCPPQIRTPRGPGGGIAGRPIPGGGVGGASGGIDGGGNGGNGGQQPGQGSDDTSSPVDASVPDEDSTPVGDPDEPPQDPTDPPPGPPPEPPPPPAPPGSSSSSSSESSDESSSEDNDEDDDGDQEPPEQPPASSVSSTVASSESSTSSIASIASSIPDSATPPSPSNPPNPPNSSSSLSIFISTGSSESSSESLISSIASIASESSSSLFAAAPNCGDGVIQEELGEDCDEGPANSPPGTVGGVCSCDPLDDNCTTELPVIWQACRWPLCGDGVVNNEMLLNGEEVNYDLIHEECDDGNNENGDGCSSGCQIEGEEAEESSSSSISLISSISSEDSSESSVASSASSIAASSESSDNRIPQNLVHTICVDEQCIQVVGEGEDECNEALSCGTTSHLECNNQSCTEVPGAGANECSTALGIGCDEHTVCINFACTLVKGPGESECARVRDCYTKPPRERPIAIETLEVIRVIEDPETAPPAICGNGFAEVFEDCDDGNRVDGDGCSALCAREPNIEKLCSNGILEPGEECDDGNIFSGDGCNGACRLELTKTIVANTAFCGNRLLEPGEECDDGNRRSGDGCTTQCLLEIGRCGDGIVQSLLGEQCESSTHNPRLPYNCENCQFVSLSCGDGKIDPGEQCDDATANSNEPDAACRENCSIGRCGDSIIDSFEQCDDGNIRNNDGCSALCTFDTAIAVQTVRNFSAPLSFDALFENRVDLLFPEGPTTNAVPFNLPLARLQPLIQSQGPAGDTGPAAVAVIGAGAAAGFSWMRRKKRK